MNFPDISIVVPVLNASIDIDKCMASLVDQDYPRNHYEVIIVDNGSVDNTVNIINEFIKKHTEKHNGNIKIFHESKKGSYAARNTGIKNSRGDIVAFTDSDCIVSKNWLSELYKGFKSEDIGCVVGAVHPYHGKSLVERFSKNKDVLSQELTLNSNFLPYGQTANVAFRKDVLEKIGYFDETFKSGGDADIAWRMQLLTTYRLIYRPDSIIEHHHRTTLKNLFLQYFKYGLGLAMLNKKYDRNKNNMKRLTNYIKSSFEKIIKGLNPSKNKSVHNVQFSGKKSGSNLHIDSLLFLICIIGYRIGMLYGMIKFRNLTMTKMKC